MGMPEGGSDAAAVLGVLVDDLALAFSAQAGEVGDVDRIAAALVVHRADQGVDVIGLWIDLVGDCHVGGLVEGEIPSAAEHGLCRRGEGGGIGIHPRPIERVVARRDDLSLAERQVAGIQGARRLTPASGRKGVAADRIAPGFGHSPPSPAEGRRVGGIGKPREELLPVLVLAGGKKHFARRPRQFVVVRVMVAVERDFLVGCRPCRILQWPP